MLLLFSLLALVSGDVDSALHLDDQCVSEECSLNAMQLRGLKEQQETPLFTSSVLYFGSERHGKSVRKAI